MTDAKYSFDIEGMTCDHCVRAVKSALEDVTGVRSADVRVGHAEVQASDEDLHDQLATAIEEEGYEITSSSASSASSA